MIPIRSEAKGRIQGIVHDASASGATLFIEPTAVVELGNTLRELSVQETREIERILREVSNEVANDAEGLGHTVTALAELDLAFAKASYSAAIRGSKPQVGSTALNLIGARHPLLDPEAVVPITITLGGAFTILVITGPNTGGKTVTLKTVGLVAAMAQCGLHIPAEEGSRVPVFDGIYADIGDEQSIEQSLSTFSSHLSNIVEILRRADSKSLVLLDELGAGTDPIEGAALARSILKSLLEQRIPTMVATHYSELKAFAHSTPGVENASMEFNVETLRPTFRLQIGLPGRSNAFAIASRLDLDEKIIEEARASMSVSHTEFESMLSEIRDAKEESARELRRAEQAREAAEKAQAEARRQLADAESQRLELLERTRREAEIQIEATRSELNALKKDWRQVKLTRDFIESSEETLDAIRELTAGPVPKPHLPEPGAKIEVGDRVFVPALNAEGEVVSVGGDGLDVQLGTLRTHVKSDQVELRSKSKPPTSLGSSVIVPDVESPGVELHLRMMR
ncbi:MAG TPA: MutS2/Smr-associated SH3 domain-containing protein, partial [Anaerolineae bacterium]